MSDRTEHWNAVYGKSSPTEVSWFQPEATTSLSMVDACRLPASCAILDVGAGASTFVDGLVERVFADISLLDVATSAFESTRRRLSALPLEYVTADITKWTPQRKYDVWHDRAVFHFLTEEPDRAAYRAALKAGTSAGSVVILGTFALDGPERCSGLPVQKYSAASLAREFDGLLQPVEDRGERHRTPSGSEQSFVFVRFTRV